MAGSRGPAAPRMTDVAALAGVSHQTVSRVVNGAPAIRPATRDRVLTAIDQLGYRRNSAARTLVTRRTHAIGVLIPPLHDFGPTTTFRAIENALRQSGYHAIVSGSGTGPASLLEAAALVRNQGVEGIIVVAPQVWAAGVIDIAMVGIPIVVVQAEPGTGATAVSIDQSTGIRMLIDCLSALGHRRYQYLAGPSDHHEAVHRSEAFDHEIATRGLERAPTLAAAWTAESGYRAAGLLAPDVTAVVCANDQVAMGVLAGLSDAGRSVPDDVSVVGFDDLPEARYVRPALTTIRQDFAEMGEVATGILIKLVEGAERPSTDLVATPQLIIRQSVAPPRTLTRVRPEDDGRSESMLVQSEPSGR